MISVRMTEFSAAVGKGRQFESNMFSRTNAFALSNDRGRIKVETVELLKDCIRVSRIQSTGHFVDLAEDLAVTVLLPLIGQLRVGVTAAEYRIAQRALCMFGPNARRTRAEASPKAEVFQAHAVMIPRHRLDTLVKGADGSGAQWQGSPDGLPISARHPKVRRLSDLLGYITKQFDDGLPISARAGAAMAVLVEDLLSDLINQSSGALRNQRTDPAAWLRVRMTKEFMPARGDEPLSMDEVARDVGVGLRSLQIAFLEFRAMGPRDVLVRMRLERARERLLAAGPWESVTSVALDCGFAHLGRLPDRFRRIADRDARPQSPEAVLAGGQHEFRLQAGKAGRIRGCLWSFDEGHADILDALRENDRPMPGFGHLDGLGPRKGFCGVAGIGRGGLRVVKAIDHHRRDIAGDGCKEFGPGCRRQQRTEGIHRRIRLV